MKGSKSKLKVEFYVYAREWKFTLKVVIQSLYGRSFVR